MKNPHEQLHELISERLDLIAIHLLEVAVDNIDSNFIYTKEDAMNAVIIFSHVIGNISNHKSLKEKISLKKGSAKAELFGKEIRTLFMNMTGIDPVEEIKKT